MTSRESCCKGEKRDWWREKAAKEEPWISWVDCLYLHLLVPFVHLFLQHTQKAFQPPRVWHQIWESTPMKEKIDLSQMTHLKTLTTFLFGKWFDSWWRTCTDASPFIWFSRRKSTYIWSKSNRTVPSSKDYVGLKKALHTLHLWSNARELPARTWEEQETNMQDTSAQ